MKIEVKFTGLCGFVRNTNGRRLRVVLLDAKDASNCRQHEPALLVPISCWSASNQRVPVDTWRHPDYKENVHVLPLSREDLVFPVGSVGLELMGPELGQNDRCPNGTNSSSFHWIARIRDYMGGVGSMRRDVIVDPEPDGAAARVLFMSGKFGTSAFRFVEDRLTGGFLTLLWRFSHVMASGRMQPVGVDRAIAEEIVYEDDVAPVNGLVEVEAMTFGPARKPSFFLQAGSAGCIRLSIVNLPLDKIKTPTPGHEYDRDDCFAEFYSIGAAGGPGPVPTPTSSCDSGAGGLSNPKCPCACYDDSPDA